MTALQSAWTAAAKRAFQAELLHDAISAKRAWLEAWRLAEHGLHDDALAAYAFFQANPRPPDDPLPTRGEPDQAPAWMVTFCRGLVRVFAWLTRARPRAQLGPGHRPHDDAH